MSCCVISIDVPPSLSSPSFLNPPPPPYLSSSLPSSLPSSSLPSSPLTHGRFIADILKEDAKGLQQLQAHKTSTVLRERLQEIRLHALLKKEAGRREGEC